MSDEGVLSVGIDLGTTTTQMIISKISIKNMASAYTIPRITITKKEVIFESQIIFTPMTSSHLIDVRGLKSFVEQQYELAAIPKESIQIGAVIITGETARKENANNVLQALSQFAGDFVVATAGPDLESIIAGRGAGAQKYSKDHHTTVLNLDIGGGTTNLALFYDNQVIDTGCLDIGGRLIKIEPVSQLVTYIAPKMGKIIEDQQLKIKVGQVVSLTDLMKLVKIMTILLENSVGIGLISPYYEGIVTNKGIESKRPVNYLSFSGGVADCLFQKFPEDPFKYGDIGLLLGYSLAHSDLISYYPVIKSVETIRATVVGAGVHTTEISGSTITYQEGILPLKNLPVLKLSITEESGTSDEISLSIEKKLKWYQLEDEFQTVALGLTGELDPSFIRVQHYGREIVVGLSGMIREKRPIVVCVQEDMAKALGQTLHRLLPKDYPFVCIDSVSLENGDYLDIGKPVAGGRVLPIVVKTLIFN